MRLRKRIPYSMGCDSCAQLNTFKLSYMMNYCKAYPQHVKAIIDCKDGKYSPLPLAGAVGDSAVIGALSTNLPVLVVLYTPYTREDGIPVYMLFACGECLSIRYIVGLPTLMDMGPSTIDLPSLRLLCPKWDVQELALKISVPNDDPLPIDNQPLGQLSSKCAQSRARANIKAVHTACNAVHARYCEPVIEVCRSGRNIKGYGQFNSSDKDPNPIFDPTLALDDVPGAPREFACNRDPGPVAFSIQKDGNRYDNNEEWVGYVCDEDTDWYEPRGYREGELTGLEATSSGGV